VSMLVSERATFLQAAPPYHLAPVLLDPNLPAVGVPRDELHGTDVWGSLPLTVSRCGEGHRVLHLISGAPLSGSLDLAPCSRAESSA